MAYARNGCGVSYAPEFDRVSAIEIRASLNDLYMGRLPDRELMGQTLEREFGPEARGMGMRCYRKIQPRDVRTTEPIKLNIREIFQS